MSCIWARKLVLLPFFVWIPLISADWCQITAKITIIMALFLFIMQQNRQWKGWGHLWPLGDMGEVFRQWKRRIWGIGCRQYEVLLYQLHGLFSLRKKHERWTVVPSDAVEWINGSWMQKGDGLENHAPWNTRGIAPTLGCVEKLREISLRCLPPYEHGIRKG